MDREFESGITIPKINKQNKIVLDLLKEGKRITGAYLVKKYSILCYTARISNIRSMGYVVKCTRSKNGKPTYWELERNSRQ